MAQRLAIAQVSPFAWESWHEVNESVAALSRELAGRGHRVLIVAPSQSADLVAESRRAIRSDPESLLERAQDGPLLLGVGEVLPFSPTRRRAASLPVDVARTIEELLSTVALDIVHVHEPFAPSASSVALRHSRALNVGSFHLPTERVLSKQLARPLSRLLFSRLDARVASYRATADLLRSYFPGEYEVIQPGAEGTSAPAARGELGAEGTSAPPARRDLGAEGTRAPPTRGDRPIELLACGLEERAALRTFIRALRVLPPEPAWHATIWSPAPMAVPGTLSARLRERIDVVESGTVSQGEALSGADILVLASDGLRPAPDTLGAALASGVVPVASRLPVYEELLQEGRYGFQFEPGDAQTLGSQLHRLIANPALVRSAQERLLHAHPTPSWKDFTDQLEALYTGLTARRHDPVGDRRIRSRLAGRRLIDVDLHMHTDHSYDCATPVEVLLSEARARGLGAIAITDHNEISGALEARAKADGLKVIVAEEVKTADQGEVIGLFIEEKIPRGLSLQETITEIKRQGGLVYVPHPFDRMHAVPDYEHLLAVIDDVDAIEVFNPRIAISE
ncbi:MAG TPA: glycosyltransferase, partial [Solirubrobacteraceae bacterium]|nr:glycosyltransferase [Solirubrobacteraceae bacterium]